LVILSTGFGDENDKQCTRTMGITDFPLKTIATRELAAIMRKELNDDNKSPLMLSYPIIAFWAAENVNNTKRIAGISNMFPLFFGQVTHTKKR
jgi:hypothetical protein